MKPAWIYWQSPSPVRTHIIFSLAYNAVGIAVAAAGLLHPLMASSLTVIIYSMHLMDWEPSE